MRERWIRALAALGLCGALVLASACAGLKATERDRGGKPRVVVLAVEGKKSAAVRNKIVALLENRYEVVPRRRYERAARRLKARSLRAADVAAVAAELDLAAVVHGYLERGAKRRYELAVIVREGQSGAVVDELGVMLRTRRLAGKARRRLRKRLYAAVTELTSGSRRERDRDVGPRNSRLDALAEVNERESDERRERRAAESERDRREAKRAERRRERAEREARAREEREARRRAAEEREQAERDRRDAERAERAAKKRDRRDAERAERAAKKRERERAEDEIEDEPAPPPVIRRDDSGQAIDDEMPDILR